MRPKKKERQLQYYVTGNGTKDGIEYKLGRTIFFDKNEAINYTSVKEKFCEKLKSEKDNFEFGWIWSWSKCEKCLKY